MKSILVSMSSSFKKSNPILQCYTEEPEVQKPLKAQVPSYMSAQQWLIVKYIQNRPRGLARADYSNYNSSQLSFEPVETSAFKPCRKFIQPIKSQDDVSTTPRLRREQDKDPIRQGKHHSVDSTYTPKPLKPRQQRVFESQIKLDDNFIDAPVASARNEILY